jgi:signal transduction histidine kinase
VEKKNLDKRLAILGKITATVSHELRNPLGVIRSSIYVIKRLINQKDEKIAKHLERIEKQIDICDHIVGELLEYTRDNDPELLPCSLKGLISQTIADIYVPGYVHIVTAFSPKVGDILLSKEKIRRLIINIVQNSIDAITQKTKQRKDFTEGCLTIEIDLIDGTPVLKFADNGSGMTGPELEKAFNPLFTTKSTGTGLGLPIVKKIVDDHEWKIEVESEEGEGTTIKIFAKKQENCR